MRTSAIQKMRCTHAAVKSITLCGILFILSSSNVIAQTKKAPGYEWKKVTFRDRNIINQTGLTHIESGDEWWYGHRNLYSPNNSTLHIGYIAFGYIADLVHAGDEDKIRAVFNEGTDSPHNLYPASGTFFPGDIKLEGDCDEFYSTTEKRTQFRGIVARHGPGRQYGMVQDHEP